MITYLTYLTFLFCTGSMTGNNSLCPVTNESLMIPLEAQYIPQNETLVKGQVYGYKSLNPLFQFTVHRFVDYNGENVIFKGDSNEFTESIPRNYVVWKLVKVRK